MAEKTNTPTEPAGPQSGQESGKAGITKIEGVKRALARLGRDAKPLAIKDYLKRRYGIDITTGVVSFYKKDLARKAARGKPAARAESSSRPKLSPAGPPSAPDGKAGGIPLKDILTVKDLVERHGGEPIRTLVNAFAR